jgi:predicted ATPase
MVATPAPSRVAPRSPIRLQLFGRAEVVFDDGRVDVLAADRRGQLLAALALRGDWWSRDAAAALFWPEHGHREARRNLRKVLHDATALACAATAELDGEALRWRVDSDVAEFERRLAAGDIDGAMALSTTPLLTGFDAEADAFADWLTAQRAALQQRRRDAALAAGAAPTSDDPRRVRLARALLAADALDEDAVALLLRGLLAQGAASDARREYTAYAVRLAEQLGAEPSARLRALVESPATATIPASPRPESPYAFIGRSRERAALGALLLNKRERVVIVCGAGGSGKSRLAKAVLADLESSFADGGLWLPLDDLDDTAAIAPRIAQLADIALDAAREVAEQVQAYLAPRRRLIVLDNAEHLAALPEWLADWRSRLPGCRWIVTSRERLRLSDERVFALQGLGLPDSSDSAAVLASEAGQLFAHRALLARPGFDAAAQTHDMARLLHAVAGLPLAIELAAAWVRLLPMREIAAEVTATLDLLDSGEPGEERPEHRSLRATFEQSWRLLAPAEQRSLAALSVFVGRFGRRAAQAVAGTSIALLSSLVDKSLLQHVAAGAPTGSDGAHFGLHPLLRQFARDKLARSDAERRNLAARHAKYFAQWLADSEQALRSGQPPDVLEQLEAQLSDCHAAWQQALRERDRAFVERATLPLMYYHEARGRRAEGITLFAGAARLLDDGSGHADATLAMLARALATLHYRAGDAAATIDAATRGIAFARRSGARAALKGCVLNLGLALWQRGQWQDARGHFEEALAMARADHDLPGVAAAVGSLAMVAHEAGDLAAAETHYREALRVGRELGSPRAVLTHLNNLALLMLMTGTRADEALPLIDEGLRLGHEHGITVLRPQFLFALGWARLQRGEHAAARALTLQAIDAVGAGGEPHVLVESRVQLARIGLAEADVASALEEALAAVRAALPLDNPPVLLNALDCVADCQWEHGAHRKALMLWSFVAGHPQAVAADRAHARRRLDAARPDADARAWALHEARAAELIPLAQRLTAR